MDYPPNFKSKKKGLQTSEFKPHANSTTIAEAEPFGGYPQRVKSLFTKDQYQGVLNKLDKTSPTRCASNIEGITSLLTKTLKYDWIVDSGVKHYITPCRELLKALRSIEDAHVDKMEKPIGGKSQIANTEMHGIRWI